MADPTASKTAGISSTPDTKATPPKAPRARPAQTGAAAPRVVVVTQPVVVSAAATPTADGAADPIRIDRDGIDAVDARDIDVHMGGIGRADARDVAVSMGGVGLARAERVSVEMGGIGLAVARDARLSQGFARYVVAREASMEQGLVGTMIAGRATVQRTTGVFLLVAGRVDGPVKAVLDWRGGLAFGAAFGLLWALLRRR
jgi:hypothetical protein